jgi:predicted house-cleaning noncanonical NTP pyrophosphatase (MazG superfamily)
MSVPYNKLVRDRIPEIIRMAGRHPVTRVLDLADYRAALLAKLIEEAEEAEHTPAGQLATEIADILEVLEAFAEAHDIAWDYIVETAASKRAKRGGFRDRIFLEYVEELS